MKVNLIKEAYYDINEKKSSKMPFMMFMKMCGTTLNGNSDSKKDEVLPPNVRLFSNIDDFRSLSKEEINKFDTTKDVIVLSTGDFCVFLKTEQKETADNTTDITNTEMKNDNLSLTAEQGQDATTNTEEDPEDKATDL